jgi:hypothetical protein
MGIGVFTQVEWILVGRQDVYLCLRSMLTSGLSARSHKLPNCYEHDVLKEPAQPRTSVHSRRGRPSLIRSLRKSVRLNGNLGRSYRSGFFIGSYMDPQLPPALKKFQSTKLPRAGLTSDLRNVKEFYADVQGGPSLVQISSHPGGSLAIPNTASRTGQLVQWPVPAHNSSSPVHPMRLKRPRIPRQEAPAVLPTVVGIETSQEDVVPSPPPTPAKRPRKNPKSPL